MQEFYEMSLDERKERLERACRIHADNKDIGLALGIAPGSVGRLCRKWSIETPAQRKRRRRKEWRAQ